MTSAAREPRRRRRGDADRVIRDLDPVVVAGVVAGMAGLVEHRRRLPAHRTSAPFNEHRARRFRPGYAPG